MLSIARGFITTEAGEGNKREWVAEVWLAVGTKLVNWAVVGEEWMG